MSFFTVAPKETPKPLINVVEIEFLIFKTLTIFKNEYCLHNVARWASSASFIA